MGFIFVNTKQDFVIYRDNLSDSFQAIIGRKIRRIIRNFCPEVIRQVHQQEQCSLCRLHLADREPVGEQSDGVGVVTHQNS